MYISTALKLQTSPDCHQLCSIPAAFSISVHLGHCFSLVRSRCSGSHRSLLGCRQHQSCSHSGASKTERCSTSERCRRRQSSGAGAALAAMCCLGDKVRLLPRKAWGKKESRTGGKQSEKGKKGTTTPLLHVVHMQRSKDLWGSRRVSCVQDGAKWVRAERPLTTGEWTLTLVCTFIWGSEKANLTSSQSSQKVLFTPALALHTGVFFRAPHAWVQDTTWLR